MFKQKFLDGTPVPDDYARVVAKLVSAAADGDPGEQNEPVQTEHDSEEDSVPGFTA